MKITWKTVNVSVASFVAVAGLIIVVALDEMPPVTYTAECVGPNSRVIAASNTPDFKVVWDESCK